MFELNNKIRIFFFILSMILSVSTLEINILNFLSNLKCKTEIEANITANGEKIYNKTTLKPIYYEPSIGTSTVIVHIVDKNRYEEIASWNAFNYRNLLANELLKYNHELLVLGIENCQDDEVDLISEFLQDIMQYCNQNQITIEILLLDEPMEQSFPSKEKFRQRHPFGNYVETKLNIFGGTLGDCLMTICPKMEFRSKRPDPSKIKHIMFYEYRKKRRTSYNSETQWSVSVSNGEYVPANNLVLHTMNDNFWKRYPNTSIHILIVNGTEYNRIQSKRFDEFKQISNEMSANHEIFFLMGCFNFDWSEIDVVRQIIMKHSEFKGDADSYKVFTVGIGMFNTVFQNPDNMDPRRLASTKNKKVMAFAEKCNGGALNKRIFQIYDFNLKPNVTQMSVLLFNGRYVPRNESKSYCFSTRYPHEKFVFIVMDSMEMRNPDVFSVPEVNEYLKLFRNNGIVVFVIKTFNLKLYDLHIIPTWIEWHRGGVHPNRITILGGGTLETTYQYQSPFHEVFYTTPHVADELKKFRQLFVYTVENKIVRAVNINSVNTKFQILTYSMHTVNGFYDPIVISNNEMFLTGNVTKILFLIMAANKFNLATNGNEFQMQTIEELRETIGSEYPVNEWTVYLVGFENFRINDLHLFAEFVKIHTDDERPLKDFVYTFGDRIYNAEYVYKDTSPFTMVKGTPMIDEFNGFFGTWGLFLK